MEKKNSTGTAQPKTMPTQAKAKKSLVKRNLPDQNKQPSIYETGSGGGVWLRIPNANLSIYDEDTGTVRGIRYCPQEPTIFTDEQSDAARVEHVIIENKVLAVPYTKPNLVAFMDAHPANRANGGNLFFQADKGEDIQEELENVFAETDAIQLIKSRPLEELLPVAMALNINTNLEDLSIKRALVVQARANPVHFLSLIDSPMVVARSVVMQAFDFQIIEERHGAVVWFDTGKTIVSIPAGVSKADVVTRFVMTDKGSAVLEELEKQLDAIA
tara:strand:- start:30918 stop:31733 length:816 start_codon:yes stop_codon:yes gene_type:complete